ncbi:MAG TPA: thermonuclease family protein [Pseudonocardia sp.]|jgi:micrococcal nuclease|nr:thermonuclease family protein [Pseudonocardia sp.]
MANRVLKIGIGLVAVAGVGIAVAKTTGTTAAIALPQPPPEQAQVATLVDGDTFDVRFNDQITRVRLANVDTPAPAGPDKPVQCLGAEATAQLAQIIPAGTPLKLSYDKDRFGRTAAAATTTDGRLVNAEVVRTGLAQVVKSDADSAVPPAVDAAAQEALTAKRGLHAADVPCTVAGQVKAVVDMVAKVPTSARPGASAIDLATSANSATDARMAAEELDSAFAQNRQELVWLVLDPNERAQLQQQVRAARDQAAADESTLRNAANVTVNQQATAAAAQAEAARIAKKLADIRKAEADRAAEAARRAAAARKAQADAAAEAQRQLDAQRQAQLDAQNKKAKKSRQADPTDTNSSSGDTTGSSSDSSSSSSGDSSGSSSGSSSDSSSSSGNSSGSSSGSSSDSSSSSSGGKKKSSGSSGN